MTSISIDEQNPLARCRVLGCGAWSPWFESWDGLRSALKGGALDAHGQKPAAAVIPSTERRRAPIPVKLAVEASAQACEAAGVSPATPASVFVSGLGDTQLTDYMCKTLASENKALSPTRFHNSVHNAAAGYWTISVGCSAASNSLAAFEESVSMALLEAAVQMQQESRPVLLSFYDAPVAPLLEPLLHNRHPFAFSILLAPEDFQVAETKKGQSPLLSLGTRSATVGWPPLKLPSELEDCYANNPAARSLLLASMLADNDAGQTRTVPLSSGVALELRVQ